MRMLSLGFCLILALPLAAADKIEPTADEKAVLELSNKERKAADVKPLAFDAVLMKAARDHAANMAKQGKLSHELDGIAFGDRLQATGYKYGSAAENVAAGQKTPAKAIESWMNSEGHKQNLLNPGLTVLGVGIAKGDDGTIYWCQIFATPAK